MADTQPLLGGESSGPQVSRYEARRESARGMLSSKRKHYVIMSLVALDVATIIADVLIALVACDLNVEDREWVADSEEALKIAGLVFSSLFLLELLLSVWAFGYDFFGSWFHIFDALIILVSFVVDILAHGILGEIGSLVIILRLFRFVKIVEELSVGASEQMEDIEARIEGLEKENHDLKERIESLKQQAGKPDDDAA